MENRPGMGWGSQRPDKPMDTCWVLVNFFSRVESGLREPNKDFITADLV